MRFEHSFNLHSPRGWYSDEIFQVSLEALKSTCIYLVAYTKSTLTWKALRQRNRLSYIFKLEFLNTLSVSLPSLSQKKKIVMKIKINQNKLSWVNIRQIFFNAIDEKFYEHYLIRTNLEFNSNLKLNILEDVALD